MEELKKCPFCGTLPITIVQVTQMGGGDDRVDFMVFCQECGAEKRIRLKICRKATFADINKAMDDAIAEWNRRAE